MKKMVMTTGMALILFIAGALTLTAQQSMRGMRMDSTRMHRMMMNPEHMQMMMNSDSMPMRRMGHRMGPDMMRPGMGRMGRGGMMGGMQGGMIYCPMMQQGMGMQRHGMGMDQVMMGMMHQGMLIDNIPNLTDKQKKDIAVLRVDQQTEMQKFREEMQSKFMAIRETQRSSIEKLLTPDQKKWLDENTPKPENSQKQGDAPAKAK
jgi:hypothetical protein